MLFRSYQPKVVDIFIKPEKVREYVQELHLVPATKKYNLRLFNQFSNKIQFEANDTEYNIIHPIFIYTELLSVNNDRSRETAELIYDKYLKNTLNQ